MLALFCFKKTGTKSGQNDHFRFHKYETCFLKTLKIS